MRSALVLALLLLSACAAGPGGGSGSPPVDSAAPDAGDRLTITVDRGDGREPDRYTLACEGDEPGTHPDPTAACRHLDGLADPFAPLPADAVCTEIYGGPQTARITGSWRGDPVDVALSRVDGCHIAQWDSLGPVLPGPVGVEPPD